MTDDLRRAKELLAQSGGTCALVLSDYTHVSHARGVNPLLELIDGGNTPRNFAAADKVVGRAAAYLYVLLGAAEVYAGVMSDTAVEVLERFGVAASCSERTDTILNRTQTGLCPMESSVLDIDEPAAALAAIRAKLAELAGK